MTIKTRKVIPLGPEGIAALKNVRETFIRKFGRPPGPDDPRPMPVERAHQGIRELLVASGAPPEIIYAFEKTGADRDRAKQVVPYRSGLPGTGGCDP